MLDLVGIYMAVAVKSSLVDKVKNIETMIVRTGFLGSMGNKGSVFFRFTYLKKSIAIACGHFCAGNTNASTRVTELGDVMNKCFKGYNQKIREHDLYFIFGDLNFRMDLAYDETIALIKLKKLDKLYNYDQFHKAKESNSLFFDLEEGKIAFPPTYKYDQKTNEYSEKKKKIPSW